MNLPLTGGCACGAVRYECAAAPMMMVKCHCRDCQRISGGPYTPAVIVRFDAFKVVKGEIKRFGTPSIRGGHNLRGFCPECGSRLTGAESPEKGYIGVTAGSLDDSSWFKPKAAMFVADAQAWDMMGPGIAKYEELPPR